VRRAATGEGDHVRIVLSDALVHGWVALALEPGQEAAAGFDQSSAGYAIYLTSDGRRLAVAAEETRFWRAFCEVIARPDLADAEHLARDAGGRALQEEIASIIADRSLDEWLHRVGDRVPVTEVSDASEARRVWMAATGAPRPLVDSPHWPGGGFLPAPRLGEHDDLLGVSAG